MKAVLSKWHIGARVRYKADFLRAISCYSGDIAHAKGKITELKLIGSVSLIATVIWDKPDMPDRINVVNLEHIKMRT